MSGFLSQPGDIIIGGTFLIHVNRNYIQPLFTTNPSDLQCHTFGSESYQGMQALMFAVQEINKNPELLPNTTLGFQIFDTCTAMRRATQGMFWMLSGRQELSPNYHCNRESRLAGIIGDPGSTKAILMAQILGLYHCPQLFYYVKHVNFKTKDGNHIFFDAKGNPPPIYDIINWRVSANRSTEQIIVGSYDASAPDGKNLPVNTSTISWKTGESQIPLSRCSESCPVGFTKLTLPGKPICCFQCARCPQGQISNQTDAIMCQQCSWDTWSSFQQDKCIPKAIDFLSYEELLGLSLAAISISSSVVPLCIVSIFMRHKTTPVVRANNYSLSCLLLLSLFLCFLCSLGFIGYPQSGMCLLRQVAFGMVFSLCISSVLAKTITVVIAFTAIQPGSRLKRWTSIKVSYCVVVFCMCIQLSVCIVWLSFSPPFPEYDIKTQPGVIIINCNEGSPTAFWCMLGFLGILASISFIVAFLARRLPDSFNEAKFITFSMLAFLTVWISFIPAYFSAWGKYTVAMEIFAILSSTWAMVACIFMPKCYIILLRPVMNSREHLMKSSRAQ
ncbi:vomeronasal type-2 receptor 26 [Xenopus laevis]|uniref:Vomeronasal type-2 receptor 26 n=1 Tax=Xenopus laevis TaxID=8355 RepID=A0A8J0UGM5_XENLA|nr:vomeronasal type-2 receptor 26 [Xenopus laevis]